jgi:hypothetical protein
MSHWQGKRRLAVVTACMTRAGFADFALSRVEVTQDEYDNGVHYDRVEQQLAEAGYEEPFLHFDECDAPAFLIPAVREYLGVPAGSPDPIGPIPQEEA